MRVTSGPAYYDFLLAGHCCGCTSLVSLSEGKEQPDNKQEACDTAQDDTDDCAGLWSGEVVVGGYYALLYDHLLASNKLLGVRRILCHGRNVNGRLAWKQAVTAEGARRNIAQLRYRIEQLWYCGHSGGLRAATKSPGCALSGDGVVIVRVEEVAWSRGGTAGLLWTPGMPSGDGGGAVALRNTTTKRKERRWLRMRCQCSMHKKERKDGKAGQRKRGETWRCFFTMIP